MFDLFGFIADSLTGTAELLSTVLYCAPLFLATALYVLRGISLTLLCNASRAGAVWMAWVPFANQYLLGRQADVYTEDRVLRGEVSSEYAPSTLRRRMLGFSIVERACGAVVGAAWCIVVLFSFAGLVIAVFGGLLGSTDILESLDGLESLLGVGIIFLLAFGGVYLVFHILYLVPACKAYYRLYRMLGSRVPALWPLLLFFVPLLTAIPLFILTVKRRRELTKLFFPPVEAEEDGAEHVDFVSAEAPPSEEREDPAEPERI